MKFHAFRKDRGLGQVFRYDHAWDADMIYGCVCDDGFEGGDCSRRRCATGDDPLTGAATDTRFGFQKNEKQTIACSATGGTFTLSFRGQTTVPITATDRADVFSQKLNALPTLTGATVLYSSTSTTACAADGNFVTIEFTQNFGSLPLIVGDGAKLVHAGINAVPRLLISKAEEGTKENDVCSNRGHCDQTSGVCTCYTGFTTSNGLGRFGDRGDCGAAETTITSCPGDIPCSGHGFCSGSPQFRCFCMNGWTSGDCSVRTCPAGLAWFDLPIAENRAHQMAECSGVGTCDITKGECMCPTQFDGAACERMKCPGVDVPCNGNGRCLTMAQLALEAELNGEPVAVTYGRTPNDPRTWDHNKVQVCRCDPGFEGHDCSLRSCPRGDDPRTTGQVREVQTLSCRHTQTTTFRLSFRGAQTPWLASDIASADLALALQALSTTGGIVTVTYSTGTSACTLASAALNTISVEFTSLLGDVPPLRVEVTSVALVPTFVVNTDGVGGSVRGSMEDAECSHNGLCNYATGQCMCFDGAVSSDGFSGVGLRQDCGHLLPIEDPLAGNAQVQA